MSETTRRLAAFGADLQLAQIPDEVVDRVKRLFADAIASALAGRSTLEFGQVSRAARYLHGPGDSVVIGGGTAAPAAATFVNGYLVTARSVCDVHQPTLCHVTPVAVPPVVALAQSERLHGATVLVSLAAAMEATVRIGLGLDYPEFRGRGWHTPGVAGLIGSALGASRALGHDVDQAERSMGIAASQAGGTFASFGTPTIKFHQARSAQGALASAVLVSERFRGPTGTLTNPDGGVFGTFSDGGDPDAATDRLGERWELMEITTRAWPAAAALQSILTIVDDEEMPPPAALDRVEVALPPRSFEMNASMGWDTVFEASLSARFATSLALHSRSFWDLAPDDLADEEVGRLARSIEVVEARDLPEGGARLTLEHDGDASSWERLHPRGSPRAPASWNEVSAKMHVAGDRILGAEAVDRVVDRIRRLEEVPDAREIIAATQGVKYD